MNHYFIQITKIFMESLLGKTQTCYFRNIQSFFKKCRRFESLSFEPLVSDQCKCFVSNSVLVNHLKAAKLSTRMPKLLLLVKFER